MIAGMTGIARGRLGLPWSTNDMKNGDGPRDRRRLPTPSKGAQGDGLKRGADQTLAGTFRPSRSRMRPSTSSASSGLSVKSFFTFSAPWPRRLSL